MNRHEPGPPMHLENMREQGVLHLICYFLNGAPPSGAAGEVIQRTQEQTPAHAVAPRLARVLFLPLAGGPVHAHNRRAATLHRSGATGMSELAAQATEHGTVLLTVTSDTGQRGQAELSADKAEDLKKQLEIALLAVRMRQIEAALASPAMAGKFMPERTLSERQSPPTQAAPKRRRFPGFLRRNGRA